jgi:hypothetical protein
MDIVTLLVMSSRGAAATSGRVADDGWADRSQEPCQPGTAVFLSGTCASGRSGADSRPRGTFCPAECAGPGRSGAQMCRPTALPWQARRGPRVAEECRIVDGTALLSPQPVLLFPRDASAHGVGLPLKTHAARQTGTMDFRPMRPLAASEKQPPFAAHLDARTAAPHLGASTDASHLGASTAATRVPATSASSPSQSLEVADPKPDTPLALTAGPPAPPANARQVPSAGRGGPAASPHVKRSHGDVQHPLEVAATAASQPAEAPPPPLPVPPAVVVAAGAASTPGTTPPAPSGQPPAVEAGGTRWRVGGTVRGRAPEDDAPARQVDASASIVASQAVVGTPTAPAPKEDVVATASADATPAAGTATDPAHR